MDHLMREIQKYEATNPCKVCGELGADFASNYCPKCMSIHRNRVYAENTCRKVALQKDLKVLEGFIPYLVSFLFITGGMTMILMYFPLNW